MEEQNINMDEQTISEPLETKNNKKKKQKKEPEEFNFKKELFSWIRIFIVAVVIAFFINNVIIMNANVPSGSMENTIMTGDRMIGLRTAYWFSDPKRGDVVIFENPDYQESKRGLNDKYYVKRVIGEPGDKVVIKDAKIYINDSKEPLEETYLPEKWTEVNGSDEALEYQVPEDCYFMLGDNRNHSSDARFWEHTYVKRSKIIAEAKLIYWPFAHKGLLQSADYSKKK